MIGRSCAMCVYRRSGFTHVDDDLTFLCARRGRLANFHDPCEDWCDDISMDERITGGRGLVYVPSATAAVALRDGETVAVAYTWYKVVDGQICTLSPKGDKPIPATDDPCIRQIANEICYVLDKEASE